MSEKFKYALWFSTEGQSHAVEIFDTEKEAAQAAFSIMEYTDGSVDGVQRSDGALQKTGDWPELIVLQEEERRRVAEMPKPEPVPMRTVENPFIPPHRSYGAVKAWVPEDFPEWVGRK